MTPSVNNVTSNASSGSIGFFHFFRSIIFIFIFMLVLAMVGFSFPDFFGFYFATFWQTARLIFFATLLGVTISAFLTNKKHGEPSKVLLSSVIWFAGLQLIILGALFWGDQTPHYGITNRDQFYDQIPFSIMMILEFYVISKVFLKETPPSLSA